MGPGQSMFISIPQAVWGRSDNQMIVDLALDSPKTAQQHTCFLEVLGLWDPRNEEPLLNPSISVPWDI